MAVPRVPMPGAVTASYKAADAGGGGSGQSGGSGGMGGLGPPDGRDVYLDHCKLALMLLIGVGHALQWLLVGPGRYCSPRHRLPFNSMNEGSRCVG